MVAVSILERDTLGILPFVSNAHRCHGQHGLHLLTLPYTSLHLPTPPYPFIPQKRKAKE